MTELLRGDYWPGMLWALVVLAFVFGVPLILGRRSRVGWDEGRGVDRAHADEPKREAQDLPGLCEGTRRNLRERVCRRARAMTADGTRRAGEYPGRPSSELTRKGGAQVTAEPANRAHRAGGSMGAPRPHLAR